MYYRGNDKNYFIVTEVKGHNGGISRPAKEARRKSCMIRRENQGQFLFFLLL